VAPSQPFCNLTNFYFSISPTEYAKNLLEEEWGCFKHIGMSWDMIMRLPIQDRRALIHKHNMEQEAISNEAKINGNSNNRTYEGESINSFALMEQQNSKKRG
jgi:hypothetical protein